MSPIIYCQAFIQALLSTGGFFPKDLSFILAKSVNIGLVSSRASLTSLGEGAFLALVCDPSSVGVILVSLGNF